MNKQIPVAARDHFTRIAPQWSQLGPPLRPSADDTTFMQRIASGLASPVRVAVLGLTPEIVSCTWPIGSTLLAIDHSPAMMRALWPPTTGPLDAAAVLADWCAMPVAAESLDMVAGDGCFVVLRHPQGYADLLREVHRVLRPGGRFVVRVFLRPDEAESVAGITSDLSKGKIGSVHALKLRLLAALHAASGAGTWLDDVWRKWRSMQPLAPPVTRSGWTAAEVFSIEAYREMEARYYLPTLAEFRDAFSPWFAEDECNWGRYETAERCPTLALVRKPAS